MPMELVLDDNGNAVVKDGMPVYRHEDGSEVPFNAKSAMDKITSLNSEAKNHRIKKEEAEAKLKMFEGIDNAEEARKALETVANLTAGELVKANDVESLKRQMAENFEKDRMTLTETFNQDKTKLQRQIEAKEQTIFNMMVNSKFSESQFLRQNTIMTPDVASMVFGKSYRIEEVNGHLREVAYLKGEKIFSRENPGELASFEEAFPILWEHYPMKDVYTRSTGGGSNGTGNTGNYNTGQTIKRNDQAALSRNIEQIAAGKVKVV